MKKKRDSRTKPFTSDAGHRSGRLPVHTVYGGAHLFDADLVAKFSARALEALRLYAPTPAALGRAMGMNIPPSVAKELHARIAKKLADEPIEDFRIDFEDGFGFRSGEQEDYYAVHAAEETIAALRKKRLPHFFGIRIKPLTARRRDRALRTLDRYFTRLAFVGKGLLPHDMVVCLPKVSSPEEVALLAAHLERLERRLSIPAGRIGIEAMIETPAALMDSKGSSPIPSLVSAAKGRLRALHFGPYDFTASLGIAAHDQRLDNPVCDAARFLMKLATAGSGISLSDGPVSTLPVAPHRPAKGRRLSPAERRENSRAVHGAWRLSFRLITRALAQGYHRGWDLHPAQLPVRYAAVYSSYLTECGAMAERMKNFLDETGNATLHGVAFDDAATGEGMLNFFRRGYHCGALTIADLRSAGLTTDDISCDSIATVLEHRSP